MRRPRWLQRMIDREAARPRSGIDRWVARHREYVLRLPRWLVGSTMFASLALGISWAVTGRGLMRPLTRLYGENSGFPVIGTIAFTMLPCMIGLLVLARFLRPGPATNLPAARARDTTGE